jgi:hypothetical protein
MQASEATASKEAIKVQSAVRDIFEFARMPVGHFSSVPLLSGLFGNVPHEAYNNAGFAKKGEGEYNALAPAAPKRKSGRMIPGHKATLLLRDLSCASLLPFSSAF